MYTKKMHDEIKYIANEHFGDEIFDANGMSMGRIFTFAAVHELTERIEELESDVEYYKSECLNRT
jgi:hypothetical protein